MQHELLRVDHLQTSFFTHLGEVKSVRDIRFQVDRGEIIGIVGESGSGKSVTSLSIMGLLQYPGRIVSGNIFFNGVDIARISNAEMRKIRGEKIAMIFQDPMTSLNPLHTIGNQIIEVITEHQQLTRSQAREKAIEMLKLVGIPSPETRVDQFPHEFSGGMRQRAMIAIALACEPELLIADEPTTALDVTIQAQVLRLIKDLNQRLNTATILITHDLGVVASTCTRIIVMYGGQIMEAGTDEEIFFSPRHPYTMGLLRSVPRIAGKESKQRLIPIDGTPPDMLKPPRGCPFYPRCDFAMRICAMELPPDSSESDTHSVKCWLCHKDAPRIEAYEKLKGGVLNGQ